jgi:hypothetical protein
MARGVKLWLGLLALAAPPGVHAAERAPVEVARIEYLIASVSELKNAQFVRNGVAHDARSAATHLRRKLKAAGSRVRTAEDFITLCASSSSITGRPYRVRFKGGHEIDAEEYFKRKLAEYAATRGR